MNRICLFVTFILLSVCNKTYAAQDTVHVFFKLNVAELDEQQKAQLDSLIYTDVINQSQELLLIGYADYIGTNGYNDTLSQARANNVKAYLHYMAIPEQQITMCMGKGEVARDIALPEGYAADRRVDIVRITKEQAMAIRKPKQKPEAAIVRKASTEAVKLNLDIDIKPEMLEVGQLFVLDKIFFYAGLHKVRTESMPEMDRLYTILKDNPTVAINIEGHVCCVGPMEEALDMETGEIALSANRAKFIYNYLVKKGIDPSRLSYIGYGKRYPLSISEETREEQDMNKRVEIRVMSK